MKIINLIVFSSICFYFGLSGKVLAAGSCPDFIGDPVITPVTDTGLILTVDEVYDYVRRNRISDLRDLLSVFPDHLNKNFALVSKTGGATSGILS